MGDPFSLDMLWYSSH